MRLIQYTLTDGTRALGAIEEQSKVRRLAGVQTLYELALQAIDRGQSLEQVAGEYPGVERDDYQALIDEKRLLPPLDHPDPAHMLVAGTGLTHLGSADTRAAMHAKISNSAEENLTDSMKMFRMGVDGGKPAAGEKGVQPEWFYKGDGSIVAPPEGDLPSPDFALDGGEEPEVVGLYIIGADGTPFRLGFCIGNEFSDHVTEKQNYLYLAHSKLRHCAFGPELVTGELPSHIEGTSRIRRAGKVAWEKPFLSGESNMSHSIRNLEYHHFKYNTFLRPGDVHVHFFGTGTLSFGDGFQTEAGDVFEISAEHFGAPLRNRLAVEKAKSPEVVPL